MSDGAELHRAKDVWEELDFLLNKWKHHDNLMNSRQATFWVVQGAMFAAIAYGLRDTNWILPDRLGYLGSVVGTAAVIGFGLIRLLIMDIGCRNAFNKRICELLRMRASILRDNTISEAGWTATNPDHPINQWHTPEVSKKKYWWQIGITNYNASIVVEATMMLIMLVETIVGVTAVVTALKMLFAN